MNAIATDVFGCPLFAPFDHGPQKPGMDVDEHCHEGSGRRFLVCLFLSLCLHGLVASGLEIRILEPRMKDMLVWVDIIDPPKAPVPPAAVIERSAPVKTGAKAPVHAASEMAKVSPKKAKPLPSVVRQAAVQKSPVVDQKPTAPSERHPTAAPAPAERPGPEIQVGKLDTRTGVTVLANESGQDTLKHGAEARFMHGMATEEFVEENYIGEYSLGAKGRVWIEDDRERSGHLILHAEQMGLDRPLFRFNRFIYVYGLNPDAASPILGSVTFFSDGDHIHQFLWQHNGTQAFFPLRILP